MAQVLIRNLEDATLDALKARAKANKRSTAAEIRAIIEEAARSPDGGTRRSIWELAGSQPTMRTVEEIVEDVRRLRDEWER